MSRNYNHPASFSNPINFNMTQIEEDADVVPEFRSILEVENRYERNNALFQRVLSPDVVPRESVVSSDRRSQDSETRIRHYEYFKIKLDQEIHLDQVRFEKKRNQMAADSAKFEKDLKAFNDIDYKELEQKMADEFYEQMKNEKSAHVGSAGGEIEKEGEELSKSEPVLRSLLEKKYY